MPKKPRPPSTPPVISLEDARERRELDQIVGRLNELADGMTARTREVISLYHSWEEGAPDEAVRSGDKVEMVAYGFVGPAGFERCHDDLRVPSLALHGVQADQPVLDDATLAEEIMCPALESGACQRVLKNIGIAPCILLGAEIELLIGRGYQTGLGSAVFDRYRDSPKEEKARFARAKALVKLHEKLETEAENRDRGPRPRRPTR